MTDTIDHIICGGAGTSLGEKSILIYDHDVLNVAINLKHEALIALIGKREAMKYGRRIQRFVDGLYADLADDGVPVHTYEPHAQNFD